MKKLIISLVLLTSSFMHAAEVASEEQKKLSAKDLEEHAQFWVKQLPKLSSDELALLANYLYFESVLATYECATRHALITFHTASIRLNKQLLNNEQEALAIAAQTASLLNGLQQELLPVRTYSLKALQACLSEIENSEFTVLKKIVVNYQQYLRAVSAQFIKQDKPSIENIIQMCQKNLDMHLKKVQEGENALTLILEHKNPYVKEGMDTDVVDMDVALACADACLGAMNEMTLACASMRSMSVDLLNISALTHKIFYQHLYETSKNKGSIDIMFDENGLIDENERDELLPAFSAQKITIDKKHLAA